MSALHSALLTAEAEGALPVRVIRDGTLLTGAEAAWAQAHDFTGKAGQFLLLAGADGAPSAALFGAGETFDPQTARALAAQLPAGLWRLEGVDGPAAAQAALAFALGAYRFDR